MKNLKKVMEKIVAKSVSLQINVYTTKKEIKLFKFFIRIFKNHMNKTEKSIAKEFIFEIEKNLNSIDVSRSPIEKIVQDFERHLYDLVELEEAYDMIEIMKSRNIDLVKIEELLKAEIKGV